MYFSLIYPLFCAVALISSTTGHPQNAADISTYAPIPPAATGIPVSNSTGYRVQALGQGAYMVTDDLYQAMFLVACKSVILVDAPPTIGKNILAGIRSVTNFPISHMVYSHAHADHIGAAYLLHSGNVTVITHQQTAMELAEVTDSHRPPPTQTFTDTYKLQVCNQTLELAYKGPNHQPGNIFIYAPKQKVLMLIDIVFPGWVPFESLGEVQNVPGYIKAHDQILGYEFEYFIGGHLDRVGVRQDVVNQKEYVNDLYNNCRKAIFLSGSAPNATNPVSVQTLLPAVEAANPGNSWALFRTYVDDVANLCNNMTNEKWLGRLGGADVYGPSNANAIVESLRIDYGVLGPFGVAPG